MDPSTRDPWQLRLGALPRDERVYAVWNYHSVTPFRWGVSDCATLMGDVVWSLTSRDPLEGLRSYGSREQAARLLVASGVRSMTEWCAARFERTERHLLRVGDLAVAEISDVLMCPAVVIGGPCASKNESGIVMFPRGLIKYGFIVPCRS